jgi:hypothetical protein
MNHSQLQVVTLKHLLINNSKQIGLQFYPNRIIQLVIKDLPNVKWSKAFNMAYVVNTKQNLDLIFKNFKGVAWINSNHIFNAKTNSNTNKSISLDKFRKRQ